MSLWIPRILAIFSAIVATSGTTDMITTVDTTKPGCQRQCGNLTVPYPFGIGFSNECSLGEWYEVRCSPLFNPPRAFLSATQVEILEISEAHIKLKNIVAQSCNSDPATVSLLDLQVSAPFTFSDTLNSIFTTGCDALSLMQATKGTNATIGSLTLCSREQDVIGGTCSGIGCCRTPFPKGLKGYSIGISSAGMNLMNVSSFSPCRYAFVAETDKFTFQGISDFLDPTFGSRIIDNVPVVLDWNVGNGTTCSQAKQSLSSYACQQNTNCSDVNLGSMGYRCSCLPGYEGNPYLSPGCKDVDECAGLSNPCIHKKTCENKLGDYKCSCPKDHHGDGRLNGTGCASNNSQLPMKIGLGVSLTLLFVFICISWIYFTIRKRRILKLREKFFEQNGGLLLNQQIGSNNEITKIFTSNELKSATNNYSEDRILGKGGYGTVYKGILADNRIVAIKKSKVSDQTQIEQFINEVVILTQINHRNVVKLLGCCLESEVPLLVYEYVSNGTLTEHIHNMGSAPSWLTWGNCLRIASEAADALSYLHSAAAIPIFHRDIKSANILIDDSYDAKIADFGASRLIPLDQTRVSTLVQGTIGYLDPEYFLTGQLSEKSDVYSFGVLLAELMTREKVLSMLRKEDGKNLANHFLVAMKEDRVLEIVHVDLIKEASKEHIMYISKLIKSCLSMNGDERPTMKEVAMELEGLKKHNKHPWTDNSHQDSASFLTTSSPQGDLYPINLSTQMNVDDDSGQYNTTQKDMLIKVNDPR